MQSDRQFRAFVEPGVISSGNPAQDQTAHTRLNSFFDRPLMIAYRIKDWKKHFEISQSKRCSKMSWVAIPNSWDTHGYSLVMAHERYAEIYCAWCLMVQIASKMPLRVELVNGRPLIPEIMAVRTRTKPDIFKIALEVLCSKDIAWIEPFNYEDEYEQTPSEL